MKSVSGNAEIANPSAMLCAVLNLAPFQVWRYNTPMQPVNFPGQSFNAIGASGVCPHCGVTSLFTPRASHPEPLTVVSAANCEACKNWVLVIGLRHAGNQPCGAITVYPLGKPNDLVPPEVAQADKEVAEDFAEALRCQWIRAYKACVVMCARAIQGSAIGLGAKKDNLTKQIDELFSKGKITEALKDYAHEIRVTRNIGAHPDKDGLEDVMEQDASDIVALTREYLHHVYVMPAILKARRAATSGTPVATP